MTDLATLSDRHVLALTIWGEARGEPVEGQIAVANVVRNRLRIKIVAHPSTTWRDICLAEEQFSCFNPDPKPTSNYQAVLKAALVLQTKPVTPELGQALWIADGALSRLVLDNTHGSTHYLTSWLYHTKPPTWAQGSPVLATIGQHVFLHTA